MFVRSSTPILDEALCGAQGATYAFAANAVSHSHVISPLNAGIFFASLAAVEKVVYRLTESLPLGKTIFFGPIPLGPRNLITYSAAALIAAKCMELLGLIAATPLGITVVGAIAFAAISIAAVARLILGTPSPEDQLKEIIASNSYENRVIGFEHEGKTYPIRIVSDPNKNISAGGITINFRYLIVAKGNAPTPLLEHIRSLLPSESITVFNGGNVLFNGVPAFDALA